MESKRRKFIYHLLISTLPPHPSRSAENEELSNLSLGKKGKAEEDEAGPGKDPEVKPFPSRAEENRGARA